MTGTDPRDPLMALRAEVGKAVVGQDAAITGLVIALLCRGHVLLEGVPGDREDPDGPRPGREPVPGQQARAVHPRPHARRRHRLAGLRQPDLGVLVPPGAGLHQPAPGRRDQPDAAEDAGLAAGGHGGGPGHRRRDRPAAARPVPGGSHAEPDRVRGHLPAARGPARPLPADALGPAARPGRRVRGPGPAHGRLRPPRPRRRGRAPRRHGRRPGPGPRGRGHGRGLPRGDRLRRRPRARHAHLPVGPAGRLPPRCDRPAAHGPGVGVAGRARLRDPRRRQGPGPSRRCATGSRSGPRPSSRGSPPTPSSTPS